MTFDYYVYRHWDAEGRLLYVGRTHDFHTRHLNHRSSSPWFDEIAEITIQSFDDWGEAAKAEQNAIRTENPLHNRKGKPRQLPEEPEVAIQQPCTFYINLGASAKNAATALRCVILPGSTPSPYIEKQLRMAEEARP